MRWFAGLILAVATTVPGQIRYKANGTGAVSLSLAQEIDTRPVTPQQFGAVGDGLADDTAAVQAAINASAHVHLPSGKYKITSTLLIDDRQGMVFEGTGIRGSNNGGTLLGTLFQWAGNSTDPVIKVYGSSYVTLSGFKILANTAFPCDTGIRFETKVSRVNTRNLVRDVSISGDGLVGTLHYGIRYIAGSGGDANNDQNHYDRLTLGGYDTVGLDFNMHQSVNHVLNGVVMGSGLGADSIGIKALEGASFVLTGGGGGGHTGSDFRLEGSNVPIVINNWHSEGSAHYLQVFFDAFPFTPSDLPHQISVIGGAMNNSSLAANGRAIEFYEAGPLVISNFTVFGSTAKATVIHYDATGLTSYGFIVQGLQMWSSLTNPFDSFQPTEASGMLFISGTGISPMRNRSVNTAITLTYGATVNTDAGQGNIFVVTATNGTAFTIAAPTNPSPGQSACWTVRNTSGGALGAVTWNAAFKTAAFTSPATANSRSNCFYYNGANWIQTHQSAADVPN